MPSELPELRELDTIRLQHGWTFAELAASMKAAHTPINPRTLHYWLKGPGRHGHPHDRHVYAIQTYVAHMKEMARRQRVRKANASAKLAINGRAV